MYHVKYLFDLDIAEKALKEFFEASGLPYPVLKNAVRNTLTYSAPRMFTQEEQARFVEVCCEEFRNTDLGKFVVVGARYVGIQEAYFVPDESETQQPCNQKTAEVNSMKVKPRRV